MFTREGMETNPYLIFKMNSSLEIPVTAIYKDKRVSAICTNLAIIREVTDPSNTNRSHLFIGSFQGHQFDLQQRKGNHSSQI